MRHRILPERKGRDSASWQARHCQITSLENLSTLKVGKLDIDGSPSLATRFGIRGAPTLLVFRDGKEVSRRLGAGSKDALLALLGR